MRGRATAGHLGHGATHDRRSAGIVAPGRLAVGALTVSLGLVAPGPALAGPWVGEPGSAYAKAWVRWLPGFLYNGGAESAGRPPRLHGPYNEVSLGGYAEVAVAPHLALTVHTDGLRVFQNADGFGQPARFFASPGEPALGVRAQFPPLRTLVASLDGSVRIPVLGGSPVDTVRDRSGQPIGELTVATGVAQASVGATFGLGLARLYLVWGGGIEVAGGGWDNAAQWQAEVGWGRAGRSTRIKLLGRHALGDGSAPYHTSPSGIGNGTSYVGFVIEIERVIAEGLSLGISLAGGLPGVRRQTGGPVLSVYFAGFRASSGR